MEGFYLFQGIVGVELFVGPTVFSKSQKKIAKLTIIWEPVLTVDVNTREPCQ